MKPTPPNKVPLSLAQMASPVIEYRSPGLCASSAYIRLQLHFQAVAALLVAGSTYVPAPCTTLGARGYCP